MYKIVAMDCGTEATNTVESDVDSREEQDDDPILLALFGACSNGHCDVVKLLIEKGAEVNMRDE